MLGKIIKAEDFQRRGSFNQFHSECQLNNLLFRKGDTFKHEEILQVLNTCKKHNQLGANTLIVQSESDLTVWVEHLAPSKAISETEDNQSQAEVQNLSSSTQAPLPTKTVTKKYRGQTYEETVVDWAAVATQKQGNKPKSESRRKYRGHYID